MRARRDGTARRRIGRGLAATAAVAAIALGTGGAAGAQQQHGGAAGQEATCRSLGGSWRPSMYDGIEGFGCRINLFYGCGVDLVYDTNGNPLGGDAWCLGFSVDW